MLKKFTNRLFISFYKRIKRLGVATKGRYNETITQSTFVESIMKYISNTVIQDRDLYMRRKKPEKIDADESNKLIFRNMMIDGKDIELTDIEEEILQGQVDFYSSLYEVIDIDINISIIKTSNKRN